VNVAVASARRSTGAVHSGPTAGVSEA
jgi:hypothetical protein